MDVIDIADPTFALDAMCENVLDLSSQLGSSFTSMSSSPSSLSSPSLSYFLVGGLLVLLFIALFVYKKFANKGAPDCVGGFCNREEERDVELGLE